MMSKSARSRRKKKGKKEEKGVEKSDRRKKTKKSKDKEKNTCTNTNTNTGPVTEPVGEVSAAIDVKKKADPWAGEQTAKKMLATGVFNNDTLPGVFKELNTTKPSLSATPLFKQNLQKIRAPDFPIPDEKLVKLQHAPDYFICAAKVSVPEFNRTVILSEVPDLSVAANIENFWRMIFQEGIVSVVIAVMPLENSVTLQQLFPIANGSFANHGKMFLNNKKVESAVGVTAYTLELLPDGCSNSINTTVYHLHNWKQKRGLDNVNELVTTLDKIVKVNENTVFISMNGIGRAGTMLAIFTAMVNINKEKEVKIKETVDKLRAERCGVIESGEQFVTVHKALALWFKKKSADDEIAKKVAEFAPGL